MTDLVRINDEVITAERLIKHLKLSGQYDTLIEELVREKVTVHEAKKAGIEVSPEEVQERANQIRRVRGLHRSVDMNRWLDQLGIDLDDLEAFITEMLYYEKMQTVIVSDEAVEQYFSLNSPKFDNIVVSHILVESEGQAKEIIATVEDAPEMFDELAREHSLADTREQGGFIGTVMRGALLSEVEAKIFHAEEGQVLGPFPAPDGSSFEIFTINSKSKAALDDETTSEVRRLLKEEWLTARAKENRIELS